MKMGRAPEVKVTEEEKKLPIKEKLKLINKEIEDLFRVYKEKGYSDDDLRKATEPIWRVVELENRKWWIKFAAFVITFVLLVYMLMSIYPVAMFVSAVFRLITIKLLPLWDWRYIYYEECLLPNPYYTPVRLSEDDCKACEDIRNIDRTQNMEHNLMIHDFLYTAVPLIITDATEEWPAREIFSTINSTYEVHMDDPKLRDSIACAMISNLKMKLSDNILLLERAAKGDHRKFYAAWHQCDREPSKAMRRYMKRPYFLPPMVEVSKSSWMFISKDYEGDKYKKIPITTQVVYMSQLVGMSKVELQPKYPCNATCNTLLADLSPGETLVYVSDMWSLAWLPDSTHTKGGETIAAAAGGYFD